MKTLSYIILVFFLTINIGNLSAQKGNKKGGGKNDKVNINIKNDNVKIKVKSKGNNSNLKVNIKDGHGKHGDNGWHHGHNKIEKRYGNRTIFWLFGPGDIYNCRGKSKREKIVLFDGVCIRLGNNIGFMIGLVGDLRIKLDGKKGKWKPDRIKKMKIEINQLDDDLKLIEVKKNRIKLRLGKLKG